MEKFLGNVKNNVNAIISALNSPIVRNTAEILDVPAINSLPRQEVKPTVSKTFVYPDYTAQKQNAPQSVSQAQNQGATAETTTAVATPDNLSLQDIISLMASGSGRPVRNKQTQKTTPYARENMLAARNRIGQATSALDEALKQRENLGFSLASALSRIPQQEGAGSWLSDFARGFGGGFGMPTNMAVDRALKRYANETKDLENILKYDKELGGTVETDLGYIYPESNNNDIALAMMLLGK